MDNEQLIQQFIQQFTGPKRKEVEQFLRTLIENQVSFTEAIRRTNQEFNTTQDSVRDIAGSISGVLSNLTRSNRVVNEGRKSFVKLESIVRKIQDDQLGIYELSIKELRNSKAKAASEVQRLRFITEQLGKRKKLTNEEKELFEVSKENFENQERVVKLIDRRLGKELKLQSSLGLTGAVLDNLNKIGVRALGGIGINLGTLEEAFEQARNDARDAAQDIEGLKNASDFSVFGKRVVTLIASLKGVGKGLQEAFNDPLTLGLGILTKVSGQVFELNAAQNEFRRITGRSAETFGQITTGAVTALDLIKSSVEATKQLGLAADAVFTQKQLLNIAKAQELLGLSAQESVKLASFSKLTGQSQENFNNAILRGADASNQLFKSAVPPKIAIEEAANASADIVLSLGMAPGRLGAAASAAKALGLELAKVDSIAEGLLDFESSIQNELEAQLLTGRDINLSRAREFALTNDLVGLTEEIGKNVVTAAEFASMNRIQQAGLAKSLGLSRQELGEIVIQSSLNNSLTDKQRRKVLGVNQAQLEQFDIQKSIDKSLQSILQSLAPLLEGFAKLVANSDTVYKIISVGMVLSIGKLITGIGSAILTTIALKKEWQGITAQIVAASLASKGIGIDALGRGYNLKGGGRVASETLTGLGYSVGKGGKINLGKSLGKAGMGALALPFIKVLLAGAALYGVTKFIQSRLKENKSNIFKEGNDVISKPGYGDRVLLDKGTITPLYNGDTIFAASNSPTQMSTNGSRVEQLLERLISNTEKTGAVYIDGREVGTAMVMNSYKSD